LALTQLAKRHGGVAQTMNARTFYAYGRQFFDPCNVAAIVSDPGVFGIHVKRKRYANEIPTRGSLYEWAFHNVEGLY
jgi:hypothetical protein